MKALILVALLAGCERGRLEDDLGMASRIEEITVAHVAVARVVIREHAVRRDDYPPRLQAARRLVIDEAAAALQEQADGVGVAEMFDAERDRKMLRVDAVFLGRCARWRTAPRPPRA